jgi:hypothetical protein
MFEDRIVEDRIQKALQALREADEEREASRELEARLVQAFRWRKRRVWRWAGIGTAAGIVGLAVLAQMNRPAQRRLTEVAPAVTAPAPRVVAGASIEAPSEPPKPRLATRKPRPQLREIVTQFYPLMDTPPPFERGELVRVSLPVSALRRAGFEVEGASPDDSVEVDVLMGEEGLARAIRFVSYQQ